MGNGGVKENSTRRVIHAIHRTTHREATYRLVDDGDSVTRDGDHVANDGSIEQKTRTEKEVSESNEEITITGNHE
jgi:hypothetical protein